MNIVVVFFRGFLGVFGSFEVVDISLVFMGVNVFGGKGLLFFRNF